MMGDIIKVPPETILEQQASLFCSGYVSSVYNNNMTEAMT